LLLSLLPYLPVPPSLAGRVEQHRQLAQEAKKLRTDIRKIEQEAQKRPELKPLAAELSQLAKDLQKPSMDPAEALKELNAAQDRLKDIQSRSEKLQKDALAHELDRLAKEGKLPGQMTESEKKQIQQMARELEQAMSDQNLEGGKEARSALEGGRLSKEQMEQMKKSFDKFKDEQAETEKRMAELQKSMDNAKKSASAGKNRVIFNSKIDDRKVETGRSSVEDGPGTTNKDVGPSKFDTHKQGKGQYMEDRTKAEYEQLYKGQREKAGSDPLFLNSQWDAENARFTRIRTFGVSSDTGTTGSSIESVAQSDEESVIRKEKIPASYRNLVKKYFESIHP
ncbi:MAG TPA: hypothetical protein VLR94_09770, partial [Acidobacteriota bacterium]|nr:hypothetical protein [Acidobacteriota bacterium]